MRKVLTILVLLASVFPFCASAKARFEASAEWGVSPLLLSSELYSYYSNQGFRVSEGDGTMGFNYYTNAFLYATAGVNFAKYFGLAAKAGYAGLCEGYRVFPLGLRLLAYPSGYERDGVYLTADASVALHGGAAEDETLLGSIGIGYRHGLYGSMGLKAFARVCGSTFSPLPVDPYEGVIPRSRVISSSRTCIALEIGIGIYF